MILTSLSFRSIGWMVLKEKSKNMILTVLPGLFQMGEGMMI